jgi:hypothetical protein
MLLWWSASGVRWSASDRAGVAGADASDGFVRHAILEPRAATWRGGESLNAAEERKLTMLSNMMDERNGAEQGSWGKGRETREKRGERELRRGGSKGDDDDGELVGEENEKMSLVVEVVVG